MNRLRLLLFTLGIAVLTCLPTQAQDDAMKARFRERKPQLDALVAAGAVAENDRGYLSLVKKDNPVAAELVEAENKDRAALYETIAKATGVDAKTVGERRAKQIKGE